MLGAKKKKKKVQIESEFESIKWLHPPREF